ncbi:hypothetical protein Pmar_PMAR003354 [Perkinsus marinus ATCC 50983]|uniref:Uncharacterized protein n=1 Tax=Perkinsus marinus (strain ATCC 50983 / TXsc) TaxID=423536 RepID=C5KH35_PERM5|nr:hypothetical protein Pmar_PMAR003354 [Perkinsus marinus ATCC 50983]EER15897.1 hypothetical protein Pmar_PMAR003354 [Perkinsus marinus ATCC 50983]|eukprot:XP_002784101.1 hypothetical protein Pmar_PMAR003354 [Perkinsus marinus ATCC 50983]
MQLTTPRILTLFALIWCVAEASSKRIGKLTVKGAWKTPGRFRKDADELRKRVLSNNMVKAILIGRVSADRPNSPDALSVHGVDEVDESGHPDKGEEDMGRLKDKDATNNNEESNDIGYDIDDDEEIILADDLMEDPLSAYV